MILFFFYIFKLISSSGAAWKTTGEISNMLLSYGLTYTKLTVL